jgi:hypothetical protein
MVRSSDADGNERQIVTRPSRFQAEILAAPGVDPRLYVIRLNVAPGHGVLHALLMDANKPEYYVRRNGSTYYARPEELAVIVQRGVQGSS